MGAAAIAARIPLPRAARADSAPVCGLAFDELGGPLVAVCGLTGGAGTSTLALLLARQAAAESLAPVLLAEADPLRPGLAALTGRATPRPLIALAQELDDDRVPSDTFVELAPRLRLIAATPQRCASVAPDALRALLAQARDAHGLALVDCGTHWTAESPVLAQATDIIWTIPATPTRLARGYGQLAASVAPTGGRWREVLAATAIVPRPLVSVRALRELARQRLRAPRPDPPRRAARARRSDRQRSHKPRARGAGSHAQGAIVNGSTVLARPSTVTAVAADAAVCAIAAGSLMAVTAIFVAITGIADDARRALGFGFGGVDRSMAEATRIVIHNVKFAGGTLLCATVAPLLPKWALLVTDLALATLLAFNAGAVGIAFGAYGWRAITATAPHLPLEFAGLSLAGGAYLHACRQPLSLRAIAALAGACGALLAIAAVLETYVSMGGAR